MVGTHRSTHRKGLALVATLVDGRHRWLALVVLVAFAAVVFSRRSNGLRARTRSVRIKSILRFIFAAALASALVVCSAPSRAGLLSDVDRLVDAWSARGALVVRAPTFFLEHGRSKLLDVPLEERRGSLRECLTIVVLGAEDTDFSVRSASADLVKEPSRLPSARPVTGGDDLEVRSAFGAVSLSRCGARQLDLERLVVSMRSQRGALEVLVVRSALLLGDLQEALPERAFGPVAPRGYPGRPIEPGPLAERVVRAEERARAEGAEKVVRVPTLAMPDGTGELPLRLREGCHRIEVMSAVPPTFPHRSTDVDAEARDQEGRVLSRDRSESADARLDFCLGKPTEVTIPFAGASQAVPVFAVDSTFSIPPAVPGYWGTRTRAGFAGALLRRHAPQPSSPPVAESLGITGQTMVPFGIEPGRCYLAAVSVARGEPRGLRIAATIGDRYVKDEVLDKPEGAVVAFCSESEESVRIDVEARGTSVWWTLSLFALGDNGP